MKDLGALAAAVDGLPAHKPSMEFEVEIHASLKDILCIWSPCGCLLAMGRDGSFLMPCLKAPEACEFTYEKANLALKRAQEVSKTAIVPSSAPEPPAVDASGPAVESEAAVAPPSEVPPFGTGPDGPVGSEGA